MTRIERRVCTIAFAVLCAVYSIAVADDGPLHQVQQMRPIALGTSGGNINYSSAQFCCSGTLGALVADTQGLYVVSNNHILARTNLARPGEPIIQPGLADVACSTDPARQVAALTRFVPIDFHGRSNRVDAAIAKIVPDAVDVSGEVLDLGVLSGDIAEPQVGLEVTKSGRTTGQTFGTVAAISVSIDVGYTKRCGVGSQVAHFVDQFRITPGSFSAGGDSGSVIVENTGAGTPPRAVGLLFAGTDTDTFAHPISAVMDALCVAPVGAAVLPDPTTCSSGSGGGKPPKGPKHGAQLRGFVRAADARARHEASLSAEPGVVGTGIGADGDAVIEIYVEAATTPLLARLPKSLDGVPVRVVETGKVYAFCE